MIFACQILSNRHIMEQKGGDFLDTHFVTDSETYTEKVKRLLTRYRYRFTVRKATSAAGCAWHFTVSAPPAAVFALLNENGLPYQIC